MIWFLFIVVSVVLSSLASVFYKKSLSLSNFSEFWFAWLGILWWIILCIIIFLSWKLDFSKVDYILLLLIFWILIVSIVSIYLNVVVMRTEKLSSLTPFLNVHKAIIIILSFFLFNDISIISLIITILVILIVIFSSIDYKNFKIPRSFVLTMIRQVFDASRYILYWFVLEKITAMEYTIIFTGMYFVFVIAIMKYYWDFSKLKTHSKEFYKNRFLTALFWNVSWLLSLFVISAVWLSLSILLSFLGIFLLLVIWYFVLWDKPSNKDVILSFVVTFLVWLWFMLNGSW